MKQALPLCQTDDYFTATADQQPPLRKQGSGHSADQHPSPHKEPVDILNPVHTLNPINVVGRVIKAGASAAQEVPNQALGRAMGAAGGSRSRCHLSSPRGEVHNHHEATAVEDSLGHGHTQAAAVGDGSQSGHHQAAAVEQNAQLSHQHNTDHAALSASSKHQPANSHDTSSHDSETEQSGWDKARHAVRQGKVKHSTPKVSSSGKSRDVSRSSVSDGSLSKKETGPMQYIFSRGGKLAATVAMAVASKKGNPAGASNSTSQSRGQHRDQQNQRRDQQDQADQADDVEMGNAGPSNGGAPADDSGNGAVNRSGYDAVSRHGAGDPNAAAGGQVR